MGGGASREDMQYRVEVLLANNAKLRAELGEDSKKTDVEVSLHEAYRQVCQENERLTLRHNVVRAERKLKQAEEELKLAYETAGIALPRYKNAAEASKCL